MEYNLKQRNIKLFGIHDTPDEKAHATRLETAGYQFIEGYNMLDIYNKYIPEEEKLRVSKLELMDEFEEWNIILSHSIFGYGAKFETKVFEEFVEFLKLDKNN